jgi:hypothetical protein
MITLKTKEPVFMGAPTMASVNSLLVNIKISNNTLAAAQLKDVLILANFDVTAQNITTGFPYAGTWYNLMDNTAINIVDVNAPINLQPGEYRIYGNKTANLAIADFEKESTVNLYPNPVSDYFTLNAPFAKVQVYTVSGQLVKSFASNDNPDFQFSVSELKAGFYLIKASSQNGAIEVMKFIKR